MASSGHVAFYPAFAEIEGRGVRGRFKGKAHWGPPSIATNL